MRGREQRKGMGETNWDEMRNEEYRQECKRWEKKNTGRSVKDGKRGIQERE